MLGVSRSRGRRVAHVFLCVAVVFSWWTPAPSAVMSPLMAGLLRRVRTCGDGLELEKKALPMLVPGIGELGRVLPRAASQLSRFPDVFSVGPSSVEIIAGATVSERSEAVGGVLNQLRREGVPMLQGWRNELWPVKASFDGPVELVIERAAGPLLGVRGFGCHVNGVVEGTPEKLWVGRRAATKPTYPRKLDHVVAGGLAHGEKARENVIKECAEEASIPRELAVLARSSGLVSYTQMDESEWGLKRDLLFCYDLQLPPNFIPTASDGEVESFGLWTVPEVLDSLAADNDDWKPNVALVIIDLLVRRGYLEPDDRGYVELVQSLRQ